MGAGRGAVLASQESYHNDSARASGDFTGQMYSGESFSGTFDATVQSGHMGCDAGCVAAKNRLLEQFARQDARRVDVANSIEQSAVLKETLMPGQQAMGLCIFLET